MPVKIADYTKLQSLAYYRVHVELAAQVKFWNVTKMQDWAQLSMKNRHTIRAWQTAIQFMQTNCIEAMISCRLRESNSIHSPSLYGIRTPINTMFFGPQESPPQTGPRSVQPFLQGAGTWQTDRPAKSSPVTKVHLSCIHCSLKMTRDWQMWLFAKARTEAANSTHTKSNSLATEINAQKHTNRWNATK